MNNKFLTFIVILFLSIAGNAQSDIKITGKVVDAGNNKPLQYVNIYIKGTNTGTVTNIEGRFSLIIPRKYVKGTLVFSYMGYHEVTKNVKNIKGRLLIKLQPYVQKMHKVTVKAKPPDPREILKTAMEKIKENVYQDRYKVKVFSRNFVQKDSVFVQYRKSLLNVYPKGDDIWHSKGEIIADKFLRLKKNIFSDYNLSLASVPPLDINWRVEKSDFIDDVIVKKDTVIFSKNQKIYVIDAYDKSIKPEALPYIYRLMKNYPSPYSVLFDKKAQQYFLKILEANSFHVFYFIRYYIDAKQNYDIIKTLSLSSSWGADIFTWYKDHEMEYTLTTYTNVPHKSMIDHSVSFKKTIHEKKKQYFEGMDVNSLFEQFCYGHELGIPDTFPEDIPFDSTILSEYDNAIEYGYIDSSFDHWNNAYQYIKTDSLEQKAIDQILHPEKYYDVEKFYARLDSLNKVAKKKIKTLKRKKKPTKEVSLHIYGTIIDSATYDPLPYCNIVMKNINDTTKIIGAITNENGEYNIDVPLGYDYTVTISRTGYKTLSDSLSLKFDEDVDSTFDYTTIPPDALYADFGPVELPQKKNVLKTVTVEGKTQTMDIDKQTVVVTKKMRENTIAAKDLLEKVNGITFNRVTEDIKVDGDKNVKILVNGVEKSREYILNLNPKRVKKIEVLRNISGMYAIEGYKSIVNIITYDNYRGVDLSAEYQYINNIFVRNNPFYKDKEADISLDVTRNKLNYYIKANTSSSCNNILTRSVTNYTATGETIISGNDNKPNNNDVSNYNGIKVGVDYKINRKHLIGAEAGIKGFPAGHSSMSTSFDTIMSNGTVTAMKNITNTKSNYNELDGNLYYNYNINPTAKLISYFYVTNRQSLSNQNVNGSGELNYKRTSDNLNYKLAFDKTFKKKYTLSVGGRYLANSYQSIALDSGQADFSNSFSKLTGFAYMKVKFNKNTGLTFGSSYEVYKSENEEISTRFNSFQPKLDFYKMIKENHKIVLEYSLKTQYPYLSDLNPQLNYVSPFVASRGNPQLKPYLYHNFSVEYGKTGKGFLSYFSIKPYYNYSGNEMGLSPVTQDSLIIYQNENFVRHERYGVMTTVSLELHKKLEADFDFELYKDWNKNLATPQIVDWNGYAQISYSLNPKHYFALMYQKDFAKEVSSLGYNLQGNDFMMIYWMTLQMKGRLRIVAGYILPSFYRQINDDYEATPYYIRHSYNDISMFSNMVMINVVFRFSKGKVQKITKDIDYEDYEGKEKSKIKLGF